MTQTIIVNGEEFKCGTNLPTSAPQGQFPLMAAQRPSFVLTMDQIVNIASDPNRTKMRDVFNDPQWMIQGCQRQFGSCNGWSTSSILTILRRKRGINDGLVYSGSYIYSLLNGGQDHGSALVDAMKEIQAGGSVPVSMCPASRIWRKDTIEFDSEAKKHVAAPDTIFEVTNWTELLSGISLGGVGNVAIQCDDTQIANYKGGLMPAFNGPGNHSLTCVDVEIVGGKPVLVIGNHWSSSIENMWGMAGFGYLTEASIKQTIGVHGCWIAFGSTDAGV